MAAHSLKVAITAALFASTALVAPARAQEYVPPAAPPIRETIDENGVDLTRGALVSRNHSVSIGGPGRMGLSWSRAVTSTGDFRDSTGIYLNAPVGSNTITVTIGGGSESFTKSGSDYISNEKTGATLTLASGTYTFTSREGVVYTFLPWAVDLEQYGGTHQISSVAYPTGERLTFNFEDGEWCIPNTGCQEFGTAIRLVSVEATNGYMLAFDFAASTIGGPASTKPWMTITKVTARNMSVDPASQSWPTLTLNGVTSFTDSLNRTTTYTYASGLMTGVKRPAASTNSMTIAYSSGKVSSVVNEGVTTNYTYADASGVRTTTISDAIAGNRVVKTNLATMLVTSDANELGKVTSYEYDAASGLLTKVTAPEGNSATFVYDGRGNRTMTTLTPKAGSLLSPIVTSATYPPSDATKTWKCAIGQSAAACNKPLTTRDARAQPSGVVTDYAWDQSTGELLTVTLPPPVDGGTNRPQTRYGYSQLTAQYLSGGNLVPFLSSVTRLTSISACQNTASCIGAADEAKSTIAYGTANVLPVSVASGSGNGSLTATTAFTYDTIGNRLIVDGPLTNVDDRSFTRYDAVRQVTGTVSADPDGPGTGTLPYRAQRITYNPDGQVTKVESGTIPSAASPSPPPQPDWAAFASLEAVETTYDSNARPLTQKLTGGGATHALTQASYDVIGRLDCTAQRMNIATFGSTQPAACILGTEGSAGPDRITKMTYDEASRPTKVTTAFGAGAGVQADDATVTYTDNGKVATIKDAKDNLTTNEYDGFDRLAKTRFPLPNTPNASSPTDYHELAYDANSNVTSFRVRDPVTPTYIYFTYDNLNRATFKNLPGSEPDVTYAYDNLSRLTRANQTGNNLTFNYDALNRNIAQHSSLASVTSIYDLAGRRTQLVYPPNGLNIVYDYLVTGEMTKVRENGATSGVGVLATYAYDNLGRRTQVTFGNGVVQASTFDPVSRLASLSNNLSGTTNDLTIGTPSNPMTYNPASQIVSQVRSNDLYAWTGHVNGTLLGTPNGLNQLTSYAGKTLTHDSKGNVTAFGTKSFTYSSENLLKTGPNTTTLTYDPAIRLFQVTGAATTKFAYDGLDRIAEFDGANALLRRYVHGPAVDEPIVWYEGSGLTDRRFLSADERGSIISITGSTGNLMAINKYDEFGQPQSTNTGKWGYTGQAWVPEIGEWYYKARFYDPELGRFLQPDPIGYEGGMNLYAYVGNDPVNWVDPLGLTPPPPVVVTGPSCNLGTLVIPFNPDGSSHGWQCIIYTGGSPGWGEPWALYDPALPWGVREDIGADMARSNDKACNPPADDQFFENALQVAGVIGDGLAIAGALTGNPVLAGVGVSVSIGSTMLSGALNLSQRDYVGLAGNVSGAAASFLPGGNLLRRFGGAAADPGRNAAGHFVANWRGRQGAQDIAAKGMQERLADASVGAFKCRR